MTRREPSPPVSAALPRELLRQVRRLELRTRRLVDSRFSGEYHSVFKGQGIEFAEVRAYLPGDDVRTIDWNVTARLGEPFVKKYIEERELTVLLAVDLSASQRWGSGGRFKADVVAEVAAVLSLAAVRNNDRVGMLLFTERVERVVPPRKGRRHALRLLRDLLAYEPQAAGTDLGGALEYALRSLSGRAILFLLSDFQAGDGWPRFERALARAALAHDVVAVRLTDPGEQELPALGLLSVVDPETGDPALVDSSSAEFRQAYRAVAEGERQRADRLFRRLGVDQVELRTDEPYAPALLGFFRRRERRLRR